MRIFLVPNRKNLLFWSILPPVKAIFNSIVYDLIFAFLPKDFRFQKRWHHSKTKRNMSIKKSLVVSLEKRCHISREKLTFLTFHSIQKGKYEVEEIYVNLFFQLNKISIFQFQILRNKKLDRKILKRSSNFSHY